MLMKRVSSEALFWFFLRCMLCKPIPSFHDPQSPRPWCLTPPSLAATVLKRGYGFAEHDLIYTIKTSIREPLNVWASPSRSGVTAAKKEQTIFASSRYYLTCKESSALMNGKFYVLSIIARLYCSRPKQMQYCKPTPHIIL